MAISDYLMNRLALAAQARGLSRQTETMRAEREAQAQRANLAYLNTLMQTGGSLASQIPGAIKQAAAEEAQARMNEALAGLDTGAIAADIPAPSVPPAPAETPAAIQAARTLLGYNGEGEAAQDALMRQKYRFTAEPSAAETETRKLMEGQTPPGRDSGPSIVARRDVLPTETASAAEIQALLRGVDRGAAPIATKELLEGLKPTPSAIPAANERMATRPVTTLPQRQTAAVRAQMDRNNKALQDAQIATQAAAAAGGAAGGAPFVQLYQQTQVPQATERDTVAQPAPPPPTAATDNPLSQGVQAAKEQLKQLAVDPIEVARDAYLKKIKSYKPAKWEKDSSKIADEVIKQLKIDRPADNPLYNFLSFGEYNKKIEAADRLAKRAIVTQIDTMRKTAETERRKEFMQLATLEAEQIAAAQKKQLEEQKINIKVKNETLDTGKLQEKVYNYIEADRDLNNLIAAGRNVIKSGTGFPGGADRQFNLLLNELGIAVQPITTSGAGAGVGVGSANITITGRTPDSEKMAEILRKVDENTSLSSEAKEFQRQTLLTIQKLGKAREGKSLTDADLKYYVSSLLPSNLNNPRQLLEAINQLRALNAQAYGDWNNVYGPGTQIWGIELQSIPFTEEELAAASGLGFAPVSQQTRQAGATARTQPSAAAAPQAGAGAIKGSFDQATARPPRPTRKNPP